MPKRADVPFYPAARGKQRGFADFTRPPQWMQSWGLEPTDLQRLSEAARIPAPLQKDDHLARVGDPFRDLHIVRSGTFKAYSTDSEGREHVMGFFMAGDLLGFDGLHTGRYRANFVALDTCGIAVLPYDTLDHLFQASPGLLKWVMRGMSRNIGRSEVLNGDYTADERLAALLVSLSRRFEALGFSPRSFNLAMSRRDIANYLRLAPETVSRVLGRFERDDLIRVHGPEISVLDSLRLQQLGRSLEGL